MVYAYRLFPFCFSLIALNILKMCALQLNGILSVSVVYECLSEFVAAVAIVVLYDFAAIVSLTSAIFHCLCILLLFSTSFFFVVLCIPFERLMQRGKEAN